LETKDQSDVFRLRGDQGKRVKLELQEGKTRGYFGRLLAYVYLPDGRMFNRQAVRSGYAYADPRFQHPFRDEFLELEAAARADLAGLWRGVTADQLPKCCRRKNLESFWKYRKTKPTGPTQQPTSKPDSSTAVRQ